MIKFKVNIDKCKAAKISSNNSWHEHGIKKDMVSSNSNQGFGRQWIQPELTYYINFQIVHAILSGIN